MKLDNNYKYSVAKTFTELAIQNNLIRYSTDPKETAMNVCKFHDTIAENLGEALNSNEA
ncbi:hypothetical protein [Clostridium perfringens]|uniref:hypothetical protein n=1 Tax=Clostridium perfringens TaxID=1502 RepID=UPI00130500E8|nr:hypothetical protein [Clostridium perfringens]MCX0399156.1 hypothetical protein [Clostridium perfringens]